MAIDRGARLRGRMRGERKRTDAGSGSVHHRGNCRCAGVALFLECTVKRKPVDTQPGRAPPRSGLYPVAPRSGLYPCQQCGQSDPARMYALMALWFGHLVLPHVHAGYFYICPRCYAALITPHEQTILVHLCGQHPHTQRHDAEPPLQA